MRAFSPVSSFINLAVPLKFALLAIIFGAEPAFIDPIDKEILSLGSNSDIHRLYRLSIILTKAWIGELERSGLEPCPPFP